MYLKGKVVIVTGASQGIGLEIGKLLLSHSAKVAFCSRSIIEKWPTLNINDPHAFPVNIDIRDARSTNAGIASVLAHFGTIDILVNNAGANGVLEYWEHMPEKMEREIIDSHVFGTLNMMRATVPSMKKTGGVIVNFASIVGWVPMPGTAVYSAAKAAIISLSESLRAELKDEKVDIRIFAPAHTTTGFNIQRPTNSTPSTVASSFIESLEKGRKCTISNGFLPSLKQWAPHLAQKIMNETGLKALAAAVGARAR